MHSSEGGEVEEAAAGAFTPVKTAVRDLVEKCWSPPAKTSRAACTDRHARKYLLEARGISLSTLVKYLQNLEQAVFKLPWSDILTVWIECQRRRMICSSRTSVGQK